MSRTISPPPLKRRRLAAANDHVTATCPDLSPQTLRIFAWNVNGITPFLPSAQRPITRFFWPTKGATLAPEPKASLRSFLERHAWPQLLLLQEVKIAPTDEKTQELVRSAVASPPASNEPHYSVFFTLPTDPHNTKGFARKVYGVCSIVRDDMLKAQRVQVRSVEWDQEGRFNVVETAGEDGWPILTIFNVYAVNGTDFDYRDPSTGEVSGTRHGRKLAVHKLLADEVAKLEADGRSVVLAGDMNVARDERDGWPRLRTRPVQHVKNRTDFTDKFFDVEKGLGMIDTFREISAERRYTYYPRGVTWGESCDRVDYVICSKAIKDNLTSAGMLDSEQERGPSDHVPVFATFDFGPDARTSRDTVVERQKT